MLFDTEKSQSMDEAMESNWKYSLARIHSSLGGVAAVCGDAVCTFSDIDQDVTGDEPSPWDDVRKSLTDLSSCISSKYPGV